MKIEISKDRSRHKAGRKGAVSFRRPTSTDGASVWNLIGDLDALDDNSMYCNLLQCTHFAETCVVAELDGDVIGWVSAYLPPAKSGTLFVWQVAVAPEARGRGLAKAMLRDLLKRGVCEDVTHMESTITKDNEASWALFRSIAGEIEGDLNHNPHFQRDQHFDGEHATEHLVRIGPIERERYASAA